MNEQITFDLIKNFSYEYNSKPENKKMENKIVKKGLENACLNKKIIEENPPIFNLELPESKRLNQKESYKCWIYAGLNTIKYDMAKNLNIDLNDFMLSNNYIAFYDKLEKSNNSYETIINLHSTNWEYVNKEDFFKEFGQETGLWIWFKCIVDKYGLVPYDVYPDAYESLDVKKITSLFADKVKKDSIKLLQAKKNKLSITELRKMKEKFLQENYNFLSKILGEPKSVFDYEYKDKNGKIIKHKNITPLEFKSRFLKLDLNDFIHIGSFPKYNFEYNKIYKQKYLGNVYKNSNIEFLNLQANEIKELAIKQLQDGIPVYFGVNLTKFRHMKSGVLDTRIYNYEETFGVDLLSKEEALNTKDIYPHHLMVICGVNLVDNKPQRWKVEDSYGIKKNEKVNGCYIMNDNYFDKFLLQAVIHKKYFSKEQLKLLNQTPNEYNIE